MSTVPAFQACHIIAPEKHADRFLTSGLLYQQEGTSDTPQVLLAYILEVRQPWFPSSQFLHNLRITLEEQYALLKPTESLADDFESLLRVVNERLNTISESGETDWIGNLNGIIAVLADNQLHFSQTGHCPAYLLQNNRIRQITDEAAEKDPHPLKTFSNLASGALQPNDSLLFANLQLYSEISLDALRRIINPVSPYVACQAIAKELKKGKITAIAPIILHVSLPDQPANAEPQFIVLEEEMQSPLRKLIKRLQPLIVLLHSHSKKAAKGGIALARKGQEALVTKVIPKASELIKKGAESARETAAKFPKKQIDDSLKTLESIQDDESVQTDKEAESNSVVEIIEPRASHRQIGVIATKPPLVPQTETLNSSLSSIGLMSTEPASEKSDKLHEFSTQIIKSIRSRNLVRPGALVLGIVLLGATLWGVIIHRRTAPVTQTSNQNAQLIKQATDLQLQAVSALALQQQIEASREISQGLDILGKITSPSAAQQSQIDDIWSALIVQSDKLTQTTRLSQTTTYSFPSLGMGLMAQLPYFYSYGPALLRTGKGEASATQATIPLSDPTDAIISLARSNESDTTAYVLTKKNKVFRLIQSIDQTSLSPIAPSDGNFEPGDQIASYNGNIYILDGKTGLLWKHANTGTVYGKGSSIIDINKYNIKDSTSLAIDGTIYILKSDGSILRFAAGVQDTNFSLKNLPVINQKIVRPLQIITSESMQSIYVLDGGTTSSDHSTARVLQFSKTGSYIGQYAFPKGYNRVSSFDISPSDKKLYIVNDGKVGEFDI